MEIVRYAPDQDLGDGLYLKHNARYRVVRIKFSETMGVFFSLEGITYGSIQRKYYLLPASGFRSIHGTRADRVKARPNTAAHKRYGDRILYLTNITLRGEAELVKCREVTSRHEQKCPSFPYDMFDHV